MGKTSEQEDGALGKPNQLWVNEQQGLAMRTTLPLPRDAVRSCTKGPQTMPEVLNLSHKAPKPGLGELFCQLLSYSKVVRVDEPCATVCYGSSEM